MGKEEGTGRFHITSKPDELSWEAKAHLLHTPELDGKKRAGERGNKKKEECIPSQKEGEEEISLETPLPFLSAEVKKGKSPFKKKITL